MRNLISNHSAPYERGVGCLSPQIELEKGRFGEIIYQRAHIQTGQHRQSVERSGSQSKKPNIDTHGLLDARFNDFHNHWLTSPKGRPVNLGQRSSGYRTFVKGAVEGIERLTEFTLYYARYRDCRHRLQRSKQFAKLFAVCDWKEVVPSCEKLAKLHVTSTAPLEVPPHDAGCRFGG
jgi:hypothetical protein